jgi:hypothetical protein
MNKYTIDQILAVAQRAREIDHEINNWPGGMKPWDQVHRGTQQMYMELAEAHMLALDELRETW